MLYYIKYLCSWLGLDYSDPMDQLQWLHDELLLAEEAGEKVWILSHLPTGNGDCMSTWGREYTKIIERLNLNC